MDPQLTGLVVAEDELENIAACLDSIQSDLNATAVLLLDQAGQVIASRSLQRAPELVTIGALLSGTFYSSRELARALKEGEFTTLYQQGPRESIHAELVKDQWILAIIFRKQTLLGMVRVVSKRSVAELATILARVRDSNRTRSSLLEANWQQGFDQTLDLIFKD